MSSNATTQRTDTPFAAKYGRTIRQRIIDDMKDTLASMTDFDGSKKLWNAVFTADISDRDNRNAPYAGIDEGEETVIEMYGGCTRKELPLIVQFRFNAMKGIDELDLFKYYLGLIQKAFLPLHEDHDLLLDIREDSNSHTIINTTDSYPGGVIVFMLQYEHARHDPYRLAGEPV
jgi:hypothetical protein